MTDTNDKTEYYIEYEECEKVAPKRAIAKFKKDIVKSQIAPEGELKLIPVLDNVIGAYNVPRILRTANIFSVQEMFVVGTKYFNPYPAVGALRHTKVKMIETPKEAIMSLHKNNYTVYVFLPPKYGGKSIWDTNFKLDGSAFIVGNEAKGISFDVKDFPFIKPIYIPHRGITESLNVSVAMSIAIAEFDRQVRTNKKNS